MDFGRFLLDIDGKKSIIDTKEEYLKVLALMEENEEKLEYKVIRLTRID